MSPAEVRAFIASVYEELVAYIGHERDVWKAMSAYSDREMQHPEDRADGGWGGVG